jgi:hypothetical protein
MYSLITKAAARDVAVAWCHAVLVHLAIFQGQTLKPDDATFPIQPFLREDQPELLQHVEISAS